MSCTCVKDHTITCRVHPNEYQQIEVMGKHIAKLGAMNAKLYCALATREMEATEYCEIIDKLQAENDRLIEVNF